MRRPPARLAGAAPLWCVWAGGLVALLAAFGAPDASAGSVLIVNARVVDGTGSPPRTASVRIREGRIAAVGDLRPRSGDAVITAGGKVLAPGFIDTHSHHDQGLFEQPDALAAVSQGITTIVVGQDGDSALPLQDFFRRLKTTPAAVNVAAYVGHGSIRQAVMGKDFQRAASAPEIEQMRALVRAGMRAGALGLSTGLEYDPGIYSTGEEVLALAREAARHGGRYISHLRSEDVKLDEAIEELIAIGRATKMPVQISHIKLAIVDRWEQAEQLLERLNRARAEGINLSADVYPYEYWQSTLTVLFPNRDFANRAAAQFALTRLSTPEGMRLSAFKPDPSVVGKTIAEIAVLRSQDPVTTYMQLIADAQAYTKTHPLSEAAASDVESVIGTSMHPRDVAALIAWPYSNICTDGGLASRHPRGAGSFTKVLRQYVREEKRLTLEQAVHKMSGLAAAHMGFTDRGTIEPGQRADLVLFDPDTVADRATIENPAALSVGIAKVWVNGVLVLANGLATGAHPGLVLKRTRRKMP